MRAYRTRFEPGFPGFRPIADRRGILFVAAACASVGAHAATGDFSGGIALSSQLVDRGQAITRSSPVAQGSLAWTDGGWSLALSASAQSHSQGGHFVGTTGQAARSWVLSPLWSMQASVLYYRYAPRQRFFDRVETGVHWTYRDVLTLGVSATSTVHTDSGHWREAADATFRWPLTQNLSASAGVGVARSLAPEYQRYSYGQVGLAWTERSWRVELIRVASDRERGWNPRYPSTDPWVATLLWSF